MLCCWDAQALGSLPQTSGRPASEPSSGRLDGASAAAGDPTGGRRAASTSAIAASPFANGNAESFDRRGSPALGPGVPVEALAAAMPSSHSAPQLEEDDRSSAAAGGRAHAAAEPAAMAAEDDGDAERRASGADGNVSVSAAAPAELHGMDKVGSGDSSGGRSPSVSGLLKALPDRRLLTPRLDYAATAQCVGESPRSVTSPRDLGVFASYPIPEEETEGAEGEQAAAAAQLPDAQGAPAAAAAQQPGKLLAGKGSGGGVGQKREAAVLDADGSSAVQQQQLMSGGEGPAAGLRGTAAH